MTHLCVGGLNDVRLLGDVTVEVDETEEVETERRGEATQQPASRDHSFCVLLSGPTLISVEFTQCCFADITRDDEIPFYSNSIFSNKNTPEYKFHVANLTRWLYNGDIVVIPW